MTHTQAAAILALDVSEALLHQTRPPGGQHTNGGCGEFTYAPREVLLAVHCAARSLLHEQDVDQLASIIRDDAIRPSVRIYLRRLLEAISGET